LAWCRHERQKRAFTQFSKGSPVSTSTVVDARAIGIARSRAVLKTKEDFRREIRTLWETASDLFLTIGEYLLQAKATLKHGEYQELISRELPFGYQVAHKLKAVAEKVKEGAIPLDRLPKRRFSQFFGHPPCNQEDACGLEQ